MVFGRKDPTCPRCVEMINGAAPRAGWSDNKRRAEALFIAEVRSHRCDHRCGPVCTFGEW